MRMVIMVITSFDEHTCVGYKMVSRNLLYLPDIRC